MKWGSSLEWGLFRIGALSRMGTLIRIGTCRVVCVCADQKVFKERLLDRDNHFTYTGYARHSRRLKTKLSPPNGGSLRIGSRQARRPNRIRHFRALRLAFPAEFISRLLRHPVHGLVDGHLGRGFWQRLPRPPA